MPVLKDALVLLKEHADAKGQREEDAQDAKLKDVGVDVVARDQQSAPQTPSPMKMT